MACHRGGRLMAGDRLGHDSREDLERARRIHRLCEKFESDWRTGFRPRIEQILDECVPDERGPLFDELMILEIELRQAAGERPVPEEYRVRFPQAAAAIEANFTRSADPADLAPSSTTILNSVHADPPTSRTPKVGDED